MKHSISYLFLIVSSGVFTTSCVENASFTKKPIVEVGRRPSTVESSTDVARRLSHSSQIVWLPRQVSGRVDGATALDNIQQAAAGHAVKMSYYGTAPGGYVRLDPRMLRALKILVDEGYSFRVTSLAGGSHSSNSRHYAGLAVDVDMINGVKVASGSAYHQRFMARCRELGATETLGPGSKGHYSHVHAAWPRRY